MILIILLLALKDAVSNEQAWVDSVVNHIKSTFIQLHTEKMAALWVIIIILLSHNAINGALWSYSWTRDVWIPRLAASGIKRLWSSFNMATQITI